MGNERLRNDYLYIYKVWKKREKVIKKRSDEK